MFEWKDKYSVNVKSIDEQHKKLFSLGNKVMEIMDNHKGIENDSYDEITLVFNELKEYAIYHFAFEEKAMIKINYKDYENHKKEHDLFIAKILELEKQDLYINQKTAILNILSFILDWITKHILKTDTRYKEDFIANQV